jgi:hypothetical protein
LTLVEYDSALLLLSLMLIGGFGFGSYFLWSWGSSSLFLLYWERQFTFGEIKTSCPYEHLSAFGESTLLRVNEKDVILCKGILKIKLQVLIQMAYLRVLLQVIVVFPWSVFFTLFIYFYFLLFSYSYVHTRLGSFHLPAPTPSLTTHSIPSLCPPPPQYPAETILPLFLILL